jgi:putative ABC transport system permease protein
MTTLIQDLQYGIRMLAKNPGFTAVAVLTLAVGIGVNTTLFTAINSVALRPAPGLQSERLVRLTRRVREGYGGSLFSYPEYTYYREANRVFSGLIARSCCSDVVVTGLASPTGNSDSGVSPERASASLVSGNFFTVLGVGAQLGRTFLPEEDLTPGAHPVALISHAFWRRHYASDPGIIGKTLLLNDTPFTVIGVTPPDFIGTADPPVVSDIWAPLAMQAAVAPGSDWLHNVSEYQMRMVGRLKAGISNDQARAEMSVLARRLAQLYAGKSHTASTVSIDTRAATFMDFSSTGPQFLALIALLTAAVSMVLVIACANVANLFLARATARHKEIAVRLALGASRPRLVRQLVVEGVPIALLGGATGLLFSVWGCAALWQATQRMIRDFAGMDFILQINPDFRVFAFTLLMSLAASLLFGLMPAVQSTKLRGSAALREDSAASGQSLSRSRFRSALVVGQVAVSLVLLTGGGLLFRALVRAESVDPGFETKKVGLFELELQNLRENKVPRSILYRNILDQLRLVPAVQSVALASHIPLLSAPSTSIEVERTRAAGRDLPTRSFYNVVSPGYFRTLNIPILRGRGFIDQERGGLSVIVSESTARRLWPGADPVGKRIKTGRSPGWLEVIGVARDTRSVRLSEPDPLLLYFSLSPSELEDPEKVLLVRTESEPRRALPALLSAMAKVDPKLPLATSGFHTLADAVWFQKIPSRVGATVAGVLGCLALILSAMGIYGLISFVVSQRTREIGIRVALGANRAAVLNLVLQQGTKLVGIGMVVGLVGSAAVGRILASALAGDLSSPDLLFGVSSFDPIAFASTSLLISSVALLASYIPARRATKVDPMVALRYE